MAYPTDPKYKLIKSSTDNTKTEAIETMDGDYRIVFLLVDGNKEYEAYKEWLSNWKAPRVEIRDMETNELIGTYSYYQLKSKYGK